MCQLNVAFYYIGLEARYMDLCTGGVPWPGLWGSGQYQISDISQGVQDCKRAQARPRDPTGAQSELGRDHRQLAGWGGFGEGFRVCLVRLTQSQLAAPQQQANLLVGVSAPWWSVRVTATA
uniref:Uncharacterized protein n=1 Tax=Myotis myotis TaxID=51298 RepID=A0A7J7Z5Y3_MYOMY|nr:hypothetical protein mMyoMyo1_010515 [Myotis myotis]